MKINRYEGYDLNALIEKAKKELGEDVKILSYEVEEKGFFPFKKRKKYTLFVEVPTPQEGFLDILSKEEKNEEIDRFLEKIEKMIDKKIEALKKSNSFVLPSPPHIQDTSVEFSEEFEEFTGDAIDLLQLLIKKDVEPKIAKIIVKESCGLDIDTNKLDLNTNFFKEAIIKGVQKKIKFTGPFKIQKGGLKIKAFVGPTGVGKTTNLFKIASELVINQKLKVAVISIDTFKVGAIQQARAYANILNIPFFAVTDSKNLRKTLEI